MGTVTRIQYVDRTWTGFRGCEHARLADGTEHPGCANCFAERMAKRNPAVLGEWGPDGTRVLAAPAYWRQPLAWDRAAGKRIAAAEARARSVRFGTAPAEALLPSSIRANAEAMRRDRVLWDLSDLFEDWQGRIHDSNGSRLFRVGDRVVAESEHDAQYGKGSRLLTLDDVRRDVFALIDATLNLTWIVPTKRPQNIRGMLYGAKSKLETAPKHPAGTPEANIWHRPNVWLGCSASTQADLDTTLPHLLACRDLSPVLFLSLEPLLEEITLPPGWNGPRRQADGCDHHWAQPFIDWVIIGCEQLAGHRPGRFADGYAAAAESVIVQCREAGIPVFHKQMPIGNRVSGDPTEWPEYLRVREFPNG